MAAVAASQTAMAAVAVNQTSRDAIYSSSVALTALAASNRVKTTSAVQGHTNYTQKASGVCFIIAAYFSTNSSSETVYYKSIYEKGSNSAVEKNFGSVLGAGTAINRFTDANGINEKFSATTTNQYTFTLKYLPCY